MAEHGNGFTHAVSTLLSWFKERAKKPKNKKGR